MASTSGTDVPPGQGDKKDVPTLPTWTSQLEAFKAAAAEYGVKQRDPLMFTVFDEKVERQFVELVEAGKRLAAEDKPTFMLEFSNVLLASCGGSHICVGCVVQGQACSAPATAGLVCGKHTANAPFNEACGLSLTRRRTCMMCTENVVDPVPCVLCARQCCSACLAELDDDPGFSQVVECGLAACNLCVVTHHAIMQLYLQAFGDGGIVRVFNVHASYDRADVVARREEVYAAIRVLPLCPFSVTNPEKAVNPLQSRTTPGKKPQPAHAALNVLNLTQAVAKKVAGKPGDEPMGDTNDLQEELGPLIPHDTMPVANVAIFEEFGARLSQFTNDEELLEKAVGNPADLARIQTIALETTQLTDDRIARLEALVGDLRGSQRTVLGTELAEQPLQVLGHLLTIDTLLGGTYDPKVIVGAKFDVCGPQGVTTALDLLGQAKTPLGKICAQTVCGRDGIDSAEEGVLFPGSVPVSENERQITLSNQKGRITPSQHHLHSLWDFTALVLAVLRTSNKGPYHVNHPRYAYLILKIDLALGSLKMLRAVVSILMTGYSPEPWGVVWVYLLIYVNKVLMPGTDPRLEHDLVRLGRMSSFQADLQSRSTAQLYMHESLMGGVKHKVKATTGAVPRAPGGTMSCVLCGSATHGYSDPRFPSGGWDHTPEMPITIACECGLFHARKGPLKSPCHR
jgi:hypothetical protein